MIIFKTNKRAIFVTIIILIIFIFCLILILFKFVNNNFAGGTLNKINFRYVNKSIPVISEENTFDINERFTRPSKDNAINIKYNFSNIDEIEKLRNSMNPKEVVELYFSILREASNMVGYSGGCGSIGYGNEPYKYAYNLFTKGSKDNSSLSEFENSFKGIGHINLIKILPAYTPPNTIDNIKYYIIEIELISGEKDSNTNESNFKYYYGLVTTEYQDSKWEIKDIKYVTEPFLCAPYHGWAYYANALVEIIYGEWYKLIDKIEDIEKNENLIYVYACGNDKKYRFDFVRLTNGYDILINENICINNEWQETNILKEEDQSFKFSILNSQLKEK